FKMTRSIDLNACKNSKSSSLPIPGITPLDQSKKVPLKIPVSRMAGARMVDWRLKMKFFHCKFTAGMVWHDHMASRKMDREDEDPPP
ncbi:hypothetical protein N9E17_01145, partial [bacterium]|nr:hypothetical protein [bacterium]